MVYADRGYDSERHRRALHKRSNRWVVELKHAWLHYFRRLRIRFECRVHIHGALLQLGSCLICWNTLQRT